MLRQVCPRSAFVQTNAQDLSLAQVKGALASFTYSLGALLCRSFARNVGDRSLHWAAGTMAGINAAVVRLLIAAFYDSA